MEEVCCEALVGHEFNKANPLFYLSRSIRSAPV